MNMQRYLAVDKKQAGLAATLSIADPLVEKFQFLGASLPTIARADFSWRTGALSFDLRPLSDGEVGVIALVARFRRQRDTDDYPLFLPVRQGDKPIELAEAFVFHPDRLGEIVRSGSDSQRYALRVQAKAEGSQPIIFTTEPVVPGTSHVTDGNLLCRFLVGKADLAELKAAAQECMAEESARHLIARIGQWLEGKQIPEHLRDRKLTLPGLLIQWIEFLQQCLQQERVRAELFVESSRDTVQKLDNCLQLINSISQLSTMTVSWKDVLAGRKRLCDWLFAHHLRTVIKAIIAIFRRQYPSTFCR